MALFYVPQCKPLSSMPNVVLNTLGETVNEFLKHYVASKEQLLNHGYPMKSSGFNIDAQEFIPRSFKSYNSLDSAENSDVESSSGNESCISNSSIKRYCVRCYKKYYVDGTTGEYLENEPCSYHFGKFRDGQWTCCLTGFKNFEGCERASNHVWCGQKDQTQNNYTCTKVRSKNQKIKGINAYTLDCEMIYTIKGLELSKVTVLDLYGCVVYESHVVPESRIIDYNTRFSGITAKNLCGVRTTLKDVQHDLLKLIYADTVLIGHGLENDLKALKISHFNVIDTAILYPHHHGFPYRYGLKFLAKNYLNLDIQVGTHDSSEDAKTAGDLVIYKLAQEFLRKTHYIMIT